MAKSKKPKNIYNPAVRKKVRPSPVIPSNESLKPSWRFSTIDKIGPFEQYFTEDSFEEELFKHIKNKIIQYENLTWAELTKSRPNHPMPREKIAPEAQRRLEQINLDDHEIFYQLQINGRERLWGVREAGVINILWWDPKHKVYPVSKKHT
jgi:hypothetical protein